MRQTDPTNPNHILIGLGGTGGKVLKAFRKRLWEEFPSAEDRSKLSIGFVYVDSTDEMMKPGDPTWKVYGQDAQFTPTEFVNIKTTDLDQILTYPDSYPGLKHLVKNGEMMKKTIGEVGAAAGQKRRAGRILFASNIAQYLSAVKAQYQKVKAVNSKTSCNIHIFTGLAGGTGSGSIIDAVAQLRADPLFNDPSSTIITVYAMVPELDIPTGCQAGRYHQNGYAALSELSALNVGAFLPCDVNNGDEHIALNTTPLKQFGLMVYSNVNENDTVVNSFSELPKLLADTVYFSMFMQTKNGINDAFIRGLTCENFNDFLVEYSTNSKNNDKERARTKGLSSFGIKRIIYPEQRVVEHISYTLADSVFKQMVYNNYKEDFGFVPDPQKKDYKQDYIRKDSLMRDWKLTDKHITLEEPILDNDKKIIKENFDDIWTNHTQFYSYDDAKSVDSDPLAYIQQFCEEKFEKDFRGQGLGKLGVKEFYSDKAKDTLLRDQAQFIVESIEKSLYTQWYEGHLSLDDMLHISDEILIYIKDRRGKLPADVDKCDEKIQGFLKELEDNHYMANHLNAIQKIAGKPKECYVTHQIILKDYYKEKTLRVAYEFAAKLLGKLQVEFEVFHEQIITFISAITKCMDEATRRIADRNKQQGSIKDMKQAVIEVREDAKVSNFEKNLLLNHNSMDSIASSLRHELVGNKTFGHFDELAKGMKVDKAFDVIDSVMSQRVRDLHDAECKKDKLIGLNILEQLKKVLVTDDDLKNFAHEAIEKSGVFILLNNTELSKSMPNNADPKTMNRKAILVTMPPAEGDDDLKAFAKRLQDSIRDAIGTATPNNIVQFDTISDVKNEITIACVKSCFPIRALKWMPFYEKEYKALTENPNPIEAKEARILLHSEGDGTCLPPIMGEKTLTAQEFIPYYFLAAAIGLINEGNDDIHGHGWFKTDKDIWGNPTNTFLSAQFTDLPTSENIDTEKRNEMQSKAEEFLKDPELTIAKRNELVESIKLLMRDVISKECSSTSSPKYQQFGAEAMKALEMINKK